MKAFLKVLLGDAWNVSVVTVILLATVTMVWGGHSAVAAFVIPPLTLGGVAVLTRH